MPFDDREYFPPTNLPDWLKDFADKSLKRGGNPFEEIKNIFKQKNDLEAVEAKVIELRERIGLDKVASKEKTHGGLGDDQPDKKYDSEQLEKGMKVELEHSNDPQVAKEIAKDHLQESKDFKGEKGGKYYDKLEKLEDDVKEELTEPEKVKANLLLKLVLLSNDYEKAGKIKTAELIRQSIQKLAEEEIEIFKKHPGIKKEIDNICTARKGHIDAPALLDIIIKRPEKISDEEINDVKKYIEKKIKEEKEEIDRSRDDEVAGLIEVHMFTVNDEDDGNKEVFNKPAKV